MANSFINILVVGDQKNVFLYDEDYKPGETFIKMKYDDIDKERRKVLSSLMVSRKKIERFGIFDVEYFDTLIKKINEMSDAGFIVNYNPECDFDDYGNAIIEKPNIKQFYSHAVCYNDRLKLLDEEGPMASPFKLKNGKTSYIANVSDIDWSIMHGAGKELYSKVWAMCVDGLEPNTEEDKKIYEAMRNRKQYFSNFSSMEDYVAVSTNFWFHAIIMENGEINVINPEKSHEWAINFYDKYIKNLKPDSQLSIYEAKANFC